jgi:HTH-type transcriptional regulator / antitoxin HigA
VAICSQTDIRTAKDHKLTNAVMNNMLDDVGEDENHLLAEVLDYLSNQVETYQADNVNIHDAPPREVLRFLVEQQGLAQSDLAPQSRISEIPIGRREISKGLAKRLRKGLG